MKHLVAFVVLFLSLQAHAQERLDYTMKFNGMLSAFTWKTFADASITTTKKPECSHDGPCLNTVIKMSSKNHELLESIRPTRFFYSSYFSTNPLRSIAFEERKFRAKDKPYNYKHKLAVVRKNGNKVDLYRLWSSGSSLTKQAASYVDKTFKKGVVPKYKQHSIHNIHTDAIDRWALIQVVRRLPLKAQMRRTLNGTNGKDHLKMIVEVKGEETIKTPGRAWPSWHLRITEIKNGGKKTDLDLWVSKDKKHIPVQIGLSESIGKVRMILK